MMVRGFGFKTKKLLRGELVRREDFGGVPTAVIRDVDGALGRIVDDFPDDKACLGCGRVPVDRADGARTCSADCEALRVQNEWRERDLARETELARRDAIYAKTRDQ